MSQLKPLWMMLNRLLITFLVIVSMGSVLAEDIEIFSGEIPPSEPNILFLLDQSGSMNDPVGTAGETRLTSLQSAFNAVISDPDIVGLNVGLMGFSNGVEQKPDSHGVSFPVSPIDDEAMPIMMSNLISAALNTDTNVGFFSLSEDNLPDPAVGQTVRSYLPDILSSWTAFGGTPIVDAYYEAALYFRGDPPFWGEAHAELNHAAHPSSYSGMILGEITQALTGRKSSCDEPDCGLNCALVSGRSYCPFGETSCFSGTNCVSPTFSYTCDLGTIEECLASNTSYSSCEVRSSESCTKTCTGERHAESGACLQPEVEECTTSDKTYCLSTGQWTICDKDYYQCDELEDTFANTTTASYKSPITNECQNNAIVVLSDGQPFVEDSAETDETRSRVKSLVGTSSDCAEVAGQVLPVTLSNSLADGRCGTELATFLANEDQNPTVDGDNTVQTYTVGFGVEDNPGAENYLKSLAESGGGKYFPATNTAGLVSAFKSIINDIDASARSFSAPVYTVDPNSMLSHSDDVYLPLFENSPLPAWAGNLKKFKLNNAGKIVDVNGDEAINEKGVLKPTAVGFWSDATLVSTADSAVTTGGVAGNLDPTNRKLLTDNGSTLVRLESSNVSKLSLGSSSMSDEYKAELLNYITGFESDGTTPRLGMGDILHSKPTVISYANKQVLFFGTNEGYLHAIDAADRDSVTSTGGSELFAYMPSSLLKNIDGQLQNSELTGPLKRIYGVDGPIAAWIIDHNKNGKVETSADQNDEAYLFFGLRRGGSDYYALNVTDPSNPSLAWKIESRGNFSQLGETWSKPVLAKLRYKKSSNIVFEDVLVFGGGYDNRIDDETVANSGSPISSVKGNGVYIVNAKTGDLIWSHTGSGLEHSVPGNIRVLDTDRNGSIDRLYFGDTGGNIWRADLNVDDVDTDASLHDVTNDARVSKFASLGGSGTEARKFFYEPDVSIFKYAGESVIAIAVGSGYRSRPLNETIEDRFFVLRDENVYSIPETAPPVITETDLINATSISDKRQGASFKGWYKNLLNGNGEKVLASPITFKNMIAFTTFANTDMTATTGSGACNALTSNQSRAYVVDLITALPVVDLNDDGIVNSSDESVVVSHGDILDSPQLVFNKPSNCSKEGCDHYVDIRVGKKLVPLVGRDTANNKTNLGDYLPKVFWIGQ